MRLLDVTVYRILYRSSLKYIHLIKTIKTLTKTIYIIFDFMYIRILRTNLNQTTIKYHDLDCV